MEDHDHQVPEIIAETEAFAILRTDEDGEVAYHVELGGITLHLTTEEWDELVVLIKSADDPVME